MIVSMRYNYALNKLTVRFNTDEVYIYDDVPVDIYAQVREASSVGKAFNAMVKGEYNYTKTQHVDTETLKEMSSGE